MGVVPAPDAKLDGEPLRALLAERANGLFVSAGELRERLATRRAQRSLRGLSRGG